MGTRGFLLGLSSAAALAAAAMQACGGDTDAIPSTDGGTDAPLDGRTRDAATDGSGGTPEAGCDTTGEFWADIPDAALGDGGSTTGICVGCLQDHCQDLLDECNIDCNCRAVVGEFLECYLESGEALPCFLAGGTSPSAKTTQIGQDLYGCLRASCQTQCAFEADAGDGGDGG
jgi:hypothetical protein